jgi:hypothetical protein
MLEMNVETHEYRSSGTPEDKSQGWFPFGPGCAKKLDKAVAE